MTVMAMVQVPDVAGADPEPPSAWAEACPESGGGAFGKAFQALIESPLSSCKILHFTTHTGRHMYPGAW